MEPRVVDLRSKLAYDPPLGTGHLHVNNLLQTSLPQQRQEGHSNIMHAGDVDVEDFVEVVHCLDAIRRIWHPADVIDQDIEALFAEQFFHLRSGLLCGLLGCDVQLHESNFTVRLGDELLESVGFAAPGCDDFADVWVDGEETGEGEA